MRNCGELYLHVGNSGVTFKVVDEGYGPTIHIVWGAFGNLNSELKVKTNRSSISQLGIMFLEAGHGSSFSEDYCHSAAAPGSHNRKDLQSTAVDLISKEKPAMWDSATKGWVGGKWRPKTKEELLRNRRIGLGEVTVRNWRDTAMALLKAEILFQNGPVEHDELSKSRGIALSHNDIEDLISRGFLDVNEQGLVEFHGHMPI